MIRWVLLLMLWAGPAPAGGVLRLLASSAAGSVDPHLNYTAQFWQVFAPVYDGLVAFRKVEGAAGTEIVPDLAESVMVDGLRYRFRLREGIRFSDGRVVGPADVLASFDRIFRVGSPTGETFYGVIEGAAACLATPAACRLSGVQAEGRDVVITLTRPDPEFLEKLALPHAAVLPADAPPRDVGTRPLAGTGPWRIASYDANEAMVLDRNPWFREWSREAQPAALPDGARYVFGLEPGAQVSSVLNGQADWMFDVPPPGRMGEIARHADQVHLNPAFALVFVPLNVNLPPFDDVRVRRAFNMAVDRRASVRLAGGGRMAVAQCGIVPAGLPGHAATCAFRYDPAAARRLVAESGRAGTPVTLVVDDSPGSRAIGTWLTEVLSDLGLPARLQVLSGSVQFTVIQNTNNRVQASLTGWYADYPSAAGIIAGNFGCAAFRPGSDSSTNIAGFCDPAVDAMVAGGDLDGAERRLAEAAPAVVLHSPRYIDVLSPRVRGFVYHETFRWLMQRAVLE